MGSINKRDYKKRIIFLGIIICTCTLFLSCSNKKDNKYDDFMNNFYDEYFQIAETIHLSDPEEVVNLMNSEDILEKMGNLEKSLTDIEEKTPENKQNNYNKLKKWYKELVDISDKKYEDWWGTTVNERINAQTILLGISVRLSDWNDKDSGIAWDQ